MDSLDDDLPKITNHAAQTDPKKGNATADHQLELEIRAFAELLVDIYEYRHKNAHGQGSQESA